MERIEDRFCDLAVIGAGVSALVAAREWQKSGLRVKLFEKSRGLGGRMATRRLGNARFDHGCQFFTVRSEPFAEEVRHWEKLGLAAPWFNHLDDQGEASLQPDKGNLRYRVKEGMTAVPKALANDLEIYRQHTVETLRWDGNYWHLSFAENESPVTARGLLCTAPVPQSLALLDKGEVNGLKAALEPLRKVEYAPCFALMALLDQQPRLGSVGFIAPNDDSKIATIADNAAKGASSRIGAVTILSTDTFARKNFDRDPEEVKAWLLDAARPWLSGCNVLESSLRRWKFARPTVSHPEPGWVSSSHRLLLAGDGFGAQPRLEQSYLSGLWAATEGNKIWSSD